ncbi:hypothetical protein [Bartonella sp. CR127HXZ]|uniref:hypothetical protein n=1 Tax=Bartonella sp. CR127HXZ TaxID=1460985 RepID=UPI0035CEAA09
MSFFIQADETLNLMVDQLTNKATVGFLSTYFLENVRFDQPHRILEANPTNRKGIVINKGACFRFYHGGENLGVGTSFTAFQGVEGFFFKEISKQERIIIYISLEKIMRVRYTVLFRKIRRFLMAIQRRIL